jgi:hypothetical protein
VRSHQQPSFVEIPTLTVAVHRTSLLYCERRKGRCCDGFRVFQTGGVPIGLRTPGRLAKESEVSEANMQGDMKWPSVGLFRAPPQPPGFVAIEISLTIRCPGPGSILQAPSQGLYTELRNHSRKKKCKLGNLRSRWCRLLGWRPARRRRGRHCHGQDTRQGEVEAPRSIKA